MSLFTVAHPKRRTFVIAQAGSLMLCMCLSGLLSAATETAQPLSDMPGFPPLPRPMDAQPMDAAPVHDEATLEESSDVGFVTQAGFNPMVTSSFSFAEMGQPVGLMLGNWQRSSGIIFALPLDGVVTDADLVLDIEVSPDLVETNTELRLLLNGQPLSIHRLGQLHDAKVTYQVSIPATMIVERNNLSFSLEDSTDDPVLCAQGADNNYWVKVLPTSHLQLQNQMLNIGPNIGRFPHPFFDPQAMQPARVEMIFSQDTRPEDVASAAIVSSYLGKIARYNNLDFPLLQNQLPEQNGIVFAPPGTQIGQLTLPQGDGPTLQVIDNPLNPVYKLMLVMGRDANEMRQAAYRLVSQSLPDKVTSLGVDPLRLPVSQPYDAPRWIDTSKPVRFGQLVESEEALDAKGVFHDAVRIAFRTAPDLFIWDGRNIPLQIDYNFPVDSWMDENKSQLNVTLNNTFLRNLPVNKKGLVELVWHQFGGDIRQESFNIPLPPYLVYGDNMLDLYFSIVPNDSSSCDFAAGDTIKSSIGPDSFIDLSKAHHFAELPNLSYFVGASFPFSRLADFSQTVLLMAEKPTLNEIQTLLNLTARSGASTGTAVANADVRFGLKGNEIEDRGFRGRDVLVVASLMQGALYQQLLEDGPFVFGNGATLEVRNRSSLEKLQTYLKGNWRTQVAEADHYLTSLTDWRGLFSFRSTWDPQRVVVVATASSDADLNKIHSDLKLPKINAEVRGDLAVITDQYGARSFQVGAQFPSGQLPWYLVVIWYASNHVVLLSLSGLLICTVLGLSLYVLLRKHATKRLGKDAEDE